MARLPRLAIAGAAHYVIQRGHNGGPVVVDDEDRRSVLGILLDAARAQQTAVHAYALTGTEIHLLVTPASAASLSLLMQSLGRRHAANFNRRHGRSGALWDGRYRAAVIEPGAALLDTLRLIDGLAADGEAAATWDRLRTSAGHRTGQARDPLISDPSEYWQLGNTPFDREARYAELLALPLPDALRAQIRHAALQGWAHGSHGFVATLAAELSRPLRPRPRGRPPRSKA